MTMPHMQLTADTEGGTIAPTKPDMPGNVSEVEWLDSPQGKRAADHFRGITKMVDRVSEDDTDEIRGLFGDAVVRAVDLDKRTATFAAATESGVETWWGREYLRMSGADLNRYRKNPVVLDTHNRYEAGAVIGKAKVQTKNRELIAEVTFAETERAEEIWTLVRTGFLNALSVGFIAQEVQVLEEGETSGTGTSRVEGPARVVKRWQLFEISVVPVPADAEALRRSFIEGDSEVALRSFTAALGRSVSQRTTSQEVTNMSNETKPETAEQKKPEAKPVDAEETRTAELEQRRRQIMAIAPESQKDLAERLVTQGVSLEDARTRLLEAQTKDRAPVGTPEPEPIKQTNEKEKEPEISDEVLKRSLTG